jgi:hypothetical protein
MGFEKSLLGFFARMMVMVAASTYRRIEETFADEQDDDGQKATDVALAPRMVQWQCSIASHHNAETSPVVATNLFITFINEKKIQARNKIKVT